MDNVSYQIKLKEQQKHICERRLNSINSTIDIKVGRIISILIIIFSVITPFLIVSFIELLKPFIIESFSGWIEPCKSCIFIYLLVSFIASMLTMSVYLFCFWKRLQVEIPVIFMINSKMHLYK